MSPFLWIPLAIAACFGLAVLIGRTLRQSQMNTIETREDRHEHAQPRP